jgi:hypothetical protein
MANCKSVKAKRCAAAFAGIALASLTAGCGMSDDTMARLLVAPDKYTLYNCQDLATVEKTTAAQVRELQQLMAKADVDSTGRLVSAMAYRSDYVSARGELNEIRQASIVKKCGLIANEDDRVSDTIIR